jgi:hypothetical protein
MADIVKEIKEKCTILGYANNWVTVTSSKASINAETSIKASRGGQATTVLEYQQKRQKPC